MSVITVPFTEVAITTLDSDGNGVCQIGPGMNQIWSPASTQIQMTGDIPGGSTPSTVTILVGFAISSALFVDATYQVTGAASSMISGQFVYYGQQIFAQWANGNSGASATLT
ncbi:MAG: hypothetical protein ACRD6W_06510, partial [Nitrososphaerales archaeon]